jgi:hypothetical protein
MRRRMQRKRTDKSFFLFLLSATETTAAPSGELSAPAAARGDP